VRGADAEITIIAEMRAIATGDFVR